MLRRLLASACLCVVAALSGCSHGISNLHPKIYIDAAFTPEEEGLILQGAIKWQNAVPELQPSYWNEAHSDIIGDALAMSEDDVIYIIRNSGPHDPDCPGAKDRNGVGDGIGGREYMKPNGNIICLNMPGITNNPVFIERAAVHELGHAYRLVHQERPPLSVMAMNLSDDVDAIQPGDVAAFRAAWNLSSLP